jgi:hypothetical protein
MYLSPFSTTKACPLLNSPALEKQKDEKDKGAKHHETKIIINFQSKEK